MHNVHAKKPRVEQSSGVTPFRNVACLVKYVQHSREQAAGTQRQKFGLISCLTKPPQMLAKTSKNSSQPRNFHNNKRHVGNCNSHLRKCGAWWSLKKYQHCLCIRSSSSYFMQLFHCFTYLISPPLHINIKQRFEFSFPCLCFPIIIVDFVNPISRRLGCHKSLLPPSLFAVAQQIKARGKSGSFPDKELILISNYQDIPQ